MRRVHRALCWLNVHVYGGERHGVIAAYPVSFRRCVHCGSTVFLEWS